SIGLGLPRALASSGGPAILPSVTQGGAQSASAGQSNSSSDYPDGAPGRLATPRTANRVVASAQETAPPGNVTDGKKSAVLGGGNGVSGALPSPDSTAG